MKCLLPLAHGPNEMCHSVTLRVDCLDVMLISRPRGRGHGCFMEGIWRTIHVAAATAGIWNPIPGVTEGCT